MWRYKVVHKFKDLQDNGHIYNVGDIYPRHPRDNVAVSKERLNELKTSKNKIGIPLIKAERAKEG